MAVSDAELQNQVLYEAGLPLVGGPLPDTFTQQMMAALEAQMPSLWNISGLWAARVSTSYQQSIQFLVAKKRAIYVLLGQMRNKKDQMVGRSLRVSWSQVFKALTDIAKLADDDLVNELKAAGNTAGGGATTASLASSGTPTTTTVTTKTVVPLGAAPGPVTGATGGYTPDPTTYPWLYIA